jgi:catechol 2,3-dioxygenase-like lactoylglutathione lyase family enzyme
VGDPRRGDTHRCQPVVVLIVVQTIAMVLTGAQTSQRVVPHVRVADIAKVYRNWSAKGAQFLTEPKDHGSEIRAYIRDPDGHLIEIGQLTRTPR